MKKLFLFLTVMIASLAFVSCGSDKEDEPNYRVTRKILCLSEGHEPHRGQLARRASFNW